MSVQAFEKSQEFNPVSQRCDKCGARGYMVAEKGTLMLVFCNHHGQEAWKKLHAQGFEVTIIPLD